MVKSIVSMLVVIAILIGGAIYESDFVHRQFEEFDEILVTLYDKIDNETAVEEDVIAVQKNWLEKKKVLHIFIPHNDIKEVDLWITEAITLVRDEKWEDAISKIVVLQELSQQIPKTFAISLENIL